MWDKHGEYSGFTICLEAWIDALRSNTPFAIIPVYYLVPEDAWEEIIYEQVCSEYTEGMPSDYKVNEDFCHKIAKERLEHFKQDTKKMGDYWVVKFDLMVHPYSDSMNCLYIGLKEAKCVDSNDILVGPVSQKYNLKWLLNNYKKIDWGNE